MKRGPRIEKERGGGQPDLPAYQRKKIRERLTRCLREFGPKSTRQGFAGAIGVSRNTVGTWLKDEPKSPVPETAQIIAIADELNVQPTWLLTGKGPELIGAQAPLGEIGGALRDHIVNTLAAELQVPPEFVASPRVLSSSAELLREVVDRQRADVVQKVAAVRKREREQSLLQRALDAPEKKLRDEAMLLSLTRFLAERRAEVDALPPLTPPPLRKPGTSLFAPPNGAPGPKYSKRPP
jgi:transcriptional regulator with XRE-family HTH domain